MSLKTRDFPQADKLEQVGRVAIAIAEGNRTDTDIEKHIGLASKGRQGRYYRHAADILGLITSSQNHSDLTPLGVEYSSLVNPKAQTDFLIRCVLETSVFQQAIAYINKFNPNNSQLKVWFIKQYPGSPVTAKRRFSTFMNYIEYLIKYKIIKETKSKYNLIKHTGVAVKQKKKLTGKGIGKRKFKSYSKDNKIINAEIDAQKKDRANINHWNLITAKSKFLHDKKFSAVENDLIDLYSEDKKDIVIYEMKSMTEINFKSQFRKAIAQLYEYRYIFSVPEARICMVTNFPISTKHKWAVDYLTKDRGIAYEWTDDFKTFECHTNSKPLLSQFAP